MKPKKSIKIKKDSKVSSAKQKNFYVVGIGASAGGFGKWGGLNSRLKRNKQ